ncbi:hypothetical protein P152DRAFT_459967 [Eremomyces bilateralis CBS 781.70]|uniref:Uncharacterized protein n=1 Tax=Eremomyces bilateralis CBS 781.70 TaxID=1392243 RepID=A0A6G1FZI4_9PEZI|nr:uncharacterized protein P152DRAFT_459967 [Eremomyces bilateralis CBS 781.70]KAF1811086.1 hypothetical protein P152DRAFT_459967 [Eremomyces bilateralis CBS 781.70]
MNSIQTTFSHQQNNFSMPSAQRCHPAIVRLNPGQPVHSVPTAESSPSSRVQSLPAPSHAQKNTIPSLASLTVSQSPLIVFSRLPLSRSSIIITPNPSSISHPQPSPPASNGAHFSPLSNRSTRSRTIPSSFHNR